MKRRDLFRWISALLTLPFLPKQRTLNFYPQIMNAEEMAAMIRKTGKQILECSGKNDYKLPLTGEFVSFWPDCVFRHKSDQLGYEKWCIAKDRKLRGKPST